MNSCCERRAAAEVGARAADHDWVGGVPAGHESGRLPAVGRPLGRNSELVLTIGLAARLGAAQPSTASASTPANAPTTARSFAADARSSSPGRDIRAWQIVRGLYGAWQRRGTSCAPCPGTCRVGVVSAFRVVRLVAGNARLVAANPQLRRVLVAWGVGIAGEWAFLVVLSVTAYERGGAAAVGIVGAVRVVPAALAAPLGSTLIDRLPRARVLVAVELAWAALVGLVPLALLAGSLVPLYLVVGVSSVVSSVFRPAVSALIPQVVERPEELTAANSLYSTLEALGTLLGPLLAGVLIQTLPTSAVYAVSAVVVALPAILVVRIRTTAKAPAREPAQLLRRLLEPLAGFSTLFGNRSVGPVVTVFAAQCVMRGLLNVYVIVAAVGVLGVGRAGVGPLFAALGVGGLLGALLALATSASRRLT